MQALTIVIAAAVLAGASNFAAAEPQRPERTAALVAAAEPWEALIRRLPEPELKRLYGECNRLGERGTLAGDHVRACSVAYDALLVGPFGGDYLALRAWSAGGDVGAAAATPGR